MSQDPDRETELRGLLQDAHRREAPPSFERLWKARARRPRWNRVAWTMAALGAVSATVALWPRRPSERPSTVAPGLALSSWHAPTDFLLATPAASLLNEPPTLYRTSWSLGQ